VACMLPKSTRGRSAESAGHVDPSS
jgi:hypothetical protein